MSEVMYKSLIYENKAILSSSPFDNVSMENKKNAELSTVAFQIIGTAACILKERNMHL